MYDSYDSNKATFVRLINGEVLLADNSRRMLCPIGFIDELHAQWIQLEGMCSEYGIGYLDYAGVSDPRIADIFSAIQQAKGQYLDTKTAMATK